MEGMGVLDDRESVPLQHTMALSFGAILGKKRGRSF